MHILRLFDLFALRNPVLFQGSEKHRTEKGAFSSAIFIGAVVATCYFFGRDVLQKKYPQVVQSERTAQFADETTLLPKLLPLAFGFQNYTDWSAFKNESLMKMQIFQMKTFFKFDPEQGTDVLTTTTDYYDLESCDRKLHFDSPELDQEWLDSLNYNQMYCLPHNVDFQVGGNFEFGTAYFLGLNILRCRQGVPAFEGIQCADDETIQSQLATNYLLIYFTSIGIDPTAAQVFNVIGKSTYTTVALNFQKEIDLTMNQIEVSIDNGVFFEQQDLQYGMVMNPLREMNIENPDLLVNMFFTLSTVTQLVTIQYKKIQNVLAEVGGVMSLLMTMIASILYIFVSTDFYVDFSNRVFMYDNHTQEIKDPTRRHSQQPRSQQEQQRSTRRKIYQDKMPTINISPLFESPQKDLTEKQYQYLVDVFRKSHDKPSYKSTYNQEESQRKVYQNCNSRINGEGQYIQLQRIDERPSGIASLLSSPQGSSNTRLNNNLDNQNSHFPFTNQNGSGGSGKSQNTNSKQTEINNYNNHLNKFSANDESQIFSVNSNESQLQSNVREPYTKKPPNIPEIGGLRMNTDNSDPIDELKQKTINIRDIIDEGANNPNSKNFKFQATKEVVTGVKQRVGRSIRKLEGNTLSLNCCDYFRIFNAKTGRQNIQLYRKAVEMIQLKTDVIQIFSRLTQFERLQRLVLDDEQINVFSFLQKPVIHYDKQTEVMTIPTLEYYQRERLKQQSRDESRIIEAFSSFCLIKNKIEIAQDLSETQFNIRLLNTIDHQIRALFQVGYEEIKSQKLLQ